MQETGLVSSRRGLLGRALTLAAGALGISAAKAEAQVAPISSLILHGRGFHLRSADNLAGTPPVGGQFATTYGELFAKPNGEAAGHFTSAFLRTDSPFAPAGAVELQTFHLADGTIHGIGSTVGSAEGHFAILGGTGRYAAARGSYVAIQHLRELGGDGSAEFHLTLVKEGAPNGR